MEEVEERVSKLEAVLGRFIVQTDMMLKRMEQDTATFKEEVRRDQLERDQDMQQFHEQVQADRQARDKDMQQFREEVRRDQQARDKDTKKFREDTDRFRQEVRADQQARDKDTKKFREEMQADRHNLEQNLERVQREIQEDLQDYKITSNKRWGELANRLGTVVEDIVAPNLPSIAQQYFGCKEIDFFGLRIKRKNQIDEKGPILEFDAILVCSNYLIVNETKTKPDASDVKSFRERQLKKIFDYFPEYQDKEVIPIFSSLSFSESTLKYLTKNKIYAMSSKGDTMDILNFEAVQKKK